MGLGLAASLLSRDSPSHRLAAGVGLLLTAAACPLSLVRQHGPVQGRAVDSCREVVTQPFIPPPGSVASSRCRVDLASCVGHPPRDPASPGVVPDPASPGVVPDPALPGVAKDPASPGVVPDPASPGVARGPASPRVAIQWPELQERELLAMKKGGEVKRPAPPAAFPWQETRWSEPHGGEMPAMKKGGGQETSSPRSSFAAGDSVVGAPRRGNAGHEEGGRSGDQLSQPHFPGRRNSG
ncbi:UNVERIFIED_CONTAM: hypothetical protein FKN15_002183 [Acipenser sinensis]